MDGKMTLDDVIETNHRNYSTLHASNKQHSAETYRRNTIDIIMNRFSDGLLNVWEMENYTSDVRAW